MLIDSQLFVSMTEANQNFSKVTHMVDENGAAVVLKNNKPRYVVVDFDDYCAAMGAVEMRALTIDRTADEILSENMPAFLELAK